MYIFLTPVPLVKAKFFLKEKEPKSSVDDLITEQQDDNEKLADDLGNDDLDGNDNPEDAPIVNGQPSESIPSNIYDSQIWDSLDPKWIDLLVEKGPAKDLSIEKGPKDQFDRRFNAAFYTQYLSNGEKHDRDWLVYSKDVDKVFCFCCKLFKKGSLKGQLANEGYNDWTRLIVWLKEHETVLITSRT
ncbi:zinc finger MYM-type protein 5-like [Pyrus x bretschneideri]|uniref:zinc finger MYM-type protein 5-like n=1 Tax=Pyrus x bretschneideri TaxID=225117 RepID=UPI002030BA6E|nr:zinc finger MYM-type protein 5-like [Pyrus x bretschneideri]